MQSKTIALIAHDNKKADLASWVERSQNTLVRHSLISTATTGQTILNLVGDLPLRRVKSGPEGGDQQIGALIAEGAVDLLIFFPDPMTPHPHDVDVKALTRLAVVYDVPMANSPSTATLILKSSYLDGDDAG